MKLKKYLFSSIGKKTVMAVSGAALGLFVIGHLLGNTTTFFGRTAFQSYAEHLHSLGIFLHFIEVGLLFIFLVHIYFAVTLYLENLKARPVRYEKFNDAGGSTFGSKTMPYTGLIILIFVLVHLKTFHFTDHSVLISDIVRRNLQDPLMVFIYLISLLSLAIHISHGFWSIFQSLGLNHPNFDKFIKDGAVVLSVFIGTIFMLIPVLTFICNDFLL